MLSGSLYEVRFAWPQQRSDGEDEHQNEPEGMKIISESELKTNQVAYINGNLLSLWLLFKTSNF